MKRTIIMCASLLIITSTITYAQESGGKFSLSIFPGFGWANNLRLEDWLNANRDIAKTTLGPNASVGSEKSTLIYGGFDLEPRYYTGNLVFAPSFGYYMTTRGERNVSNAAGTQTYHADIRLTSFSLRGTAYYNVNLSENSFLLVGGGLGYYRATVDLSSGLTSNQQSYKVHAWTIGWHSAVEYNRKIGPALISVGLMSRYAEFYHVEKNNSAGNEVIDTSGSLTGLYLYAGAGYMF